MESRLPALTAVAALLLTATVAAAPSAVAAPGDPNQVALRVEYPDGTSKQWCVDHTAGMSGAQVLSVASPSIGQTGPYAGFVLKIGGQGTTPPTDDTYWAYWTTTNGALTYSGAGVTSTRPQAGTVEVWHWNSSGTTEQPSAGSYGSICPGGYEQAAAPAPTASPVTPRASAPATSRAATPAPSDTAATPAGSTPAATPTTPLTPATPGATGDAATPSSSDGTAGVGRAVDASPVAVSTDTGGGGKPLGFALAAVAVVALGAAAAWQRRRRSAADE